MCVSSFRTRPRALRAGTPHGSHARSRVAVGGECSELALALDEDRTAVEREGGTQAARPAGPGPGGAGGFGTLRSGGDRSAVGSGITSQALTIIARAPLAPHRSGLGPRPQAPLGPVFMGASLATRLPLLLSSRPRVKAALEALSQAHRLEGISKAEDHFSQHHAPAPRATPIGAARQARAVAGGLQTLAHGSRLRAQGSELTRPRLADLDAPGGVPRGTADRNPSAIAVLEPDSTTEQLAGRIEIGPTSSAGPASTSRARAASGPDRGVDGRALSVLSPAV
jgi:hypothetical protein